MKKTNTNPNCTENEDKIMAKNQHDYSPFISYTELDNKYYPTFDFTDFNKLVKEYNHLPFLTASGLQHIDEVYNIIEAILNRQDFTVAFESSDEEKKELNVDYILLDDESYLEESLKSLQSFFDQWNRKRTKFNYMPELIKQYQNDMQIFCSDNDE